MSLLGIGLDVVMLQRIARTYARHQGRFVRRVLTLQERGQFTQRKHPITFLASRFAAKEALSKALRTGLRPPFSFQRVQINTLPSGAPTLVLYGPLLTFFKQLGGESLYLSLSDTECCAAAMVALS